MLPSFQQFRFRQIGKRSSQSTQMKALPSRVSNNSDLDKSVNDLLGQVMTGQADEGFQQFRFRQIGKQAITRHKTRSWNWFCFQQFRFRQIGKRSNHQSRLQSSVYSFQQFRFRQIGKRSCFEWSSLFFLFRPFPTIPI